MRQTRATTISLLVVTVATGCHQPTATPDAPAASNDVVGAIAMGSTTTPPLVAMSAVTQRISAHRGKFVLLDLWAMW